MCVYKCVYVYACWCERPQVNNGCLPWSPSPSFLLLFWLLCDEVWSYSTLHRFLSEPYLLPYPPDFVSFFFKKGFVFNYVYVSMCGSVHINTEARGFGCPNAGIIGSYKPPDLRVGLELRLSGRAVHAFNWWATSHFKKQVQFVLMCSWVCAFHWRVANLPGSDP